MNGLVYVFTGEGKGKTSAALGVTVRAALIGKNICWISFYKGKDWDLAEKHLPDYLLPVEMHWVGKGFHIEKPEKMIRDVKIASVVRNKVIDTATDSEHVAAAEAGLALARQKLVSGQYWLVVLDEVLNAVDDGLLSEKSLLEVLEQRQGNHVILTGRGVTDAIIQAADLVTECKKLKHPYDQGKLAIRGLDY
jgi:cob(I)alamin adenosyltransferase